MVQEITPAEAAERLQQQPSLILVDCREQNEAAICQIDSSILIPLSEWVAKAEISLPARNAETVIYCHHGMRSQRAGHYLVERGYSNIFSLAGGIHRWATEIAPAMARY